MDSKSKNQQPGSEQPLKFKKSQQSEHDHNSNRKSSEGESAKPKKPSEPSRRMSKRQTPSTPEEMDEILRRVMHLDSDDSPKQLPTSQLPTSQPPSGQPPTSQPPSGQPPTSQLPACQPAPAKQPAPQDKRDSSVKIPSAPIDPPEHVLAAVCKDELQFYSIAPEGEDGKEIPGTAVLSKSFPLGGSSGDSFCWNRDGTMFARLLPSGSVAIHLFPTYELYMEISHCDVTSDVQSSHGQSQSHVQQSSPPPCSAIKAFYFSPCSTYMVVAERWDPKTEKENASVWHIQEKQKAGQMKVKRLSGILWPMMKWNNDESLCISTSVSTRPSNISGAKSVTQIVLLNSSRDATVAFDLPGLTSIEFAPKAGLAVAFFAREDASFFNPTGESIIGEKLKDTSLDLSSSSSDEDKPPSNDKSSAMNLNAHSKPLTINSRFSSDSKIAIYDFASETPSVPVFERILQDPADSVIFNWGADGKSILIQATVEVDDTGKTYYGRNYLYVLGLNPYNNFWECFRPIEIVGAPIHDSKWLADGVFAAVAGAMPANIGIYKLSFFRDKQGEIVKVGSLGKAPRNTLRINPHSRFCFVGGFGNLPGEVDFWDIKELVNNYDRISSTGISYPGIASTAMPSSTGPSSAAVPTTHAPPSKRLAHMLKSLRMECPVDAEWASNGSRFLVSATISPRMRVSNGFVIWKYDGTKICSISLNVLYSVKWRPVQHALNKDHTSTHTSITRQGLIMDAGSSPRALATAHDAPQKTDTHQAYRPPGASSAFAAVMRGEATEDSLSYEQRKDLLAGRTNRKVINKDPKSSLEIDKLIFETNPSPKLVPKPNPAVAIESLTRSMASESAPLRGLDASSNKDAKKKELMEQIDKMVEEEKQKRLLLANTQSPERLVDSSTVSSRMMKPVSSPPPPPPAPPAPKGPVAPSVVPSAPAAPPVGPPTAPKAPPAPKAPVAPVAPPAAPVTRPVAPAAPPAPSAVLPNAYLYRDLSFKVQGPFPLKMMQAWYKAKYFAPELEIATADQPTRWVRLKDAFVGAPFASPFKTL